MSPASGRSGDVAPARPDEVVVCLALRDLHDLDVSALSQVEQARAATIAHPRTRARFVGGRCLLRTLLSRIDGAPPSSHEILVDPDGVPRLSARGKPLHLSISHGEHWDAVALAQRPVGIDVEEEVPVDGERLAQTVMSPVELEAFARLRAADRPSSFIRLWTRKEAVLKAAGRGFLVDPRSIETFWGPDPHAVAAAALPRGPYVVADVASPVTVSAALQGAGMALRLVSL